MFVSTMSSTERKSEGLCLQCAKELGLPQVSEYLKQMGISEDELESACDSIFGENGELDSDFLKQLGLDGKDDDDDAMDENFPDSDEEDVPGEEDNLFERGGDGREINGHGERDLVGIVPTVVIVNVKRLQAVVQCTDHVRRA